MNHGDAPLVSVCIPTYNRAQLLERAIDSLLNGDYKNIEIIISDNASTDETSSVCARMCLMDGRIKYHRQESNLGPTNNFDFVRQRAIGKYFIWLGDDDFLDGNYLTACVNALEADGSFLLVSGKAAYHKGDKIITHYGAIIQLNCESPFVRVRKYFRKVTENGIYCGVHRRSELCDCGIPNCLAGDWIWLAKILIRGKAKMLEEPLIFRQYGANTSSNFENIVNILNQPKWHGKFPWIATLINCARFVTEDAYIFSKKSIQFSAVIGLIVVSTISFRMIGDNIVILYRKIRKARGCVLKLFGRI